MYSQMFREATFCDESRAAAKSSEMYYIKCVTRSSRSWTQTSMTQRNRDGLFMKEMSAIYWHWLWAISTNRLSSNIWDCDQTYALKILNLAHLWRTAPQIQTERLRLCPRIIIGYILFRAFSDHISIRQSTNQRQKLTRRVADPHRRRTGFKQQICGHRLEPSSDIQIVNQQETERLTISRRKSTHTCSTPPPELKLALANTCASSYPSACGNEVFFLDEIFTACSVIALPHSCRHLRANWRAPCSPWHVVPAGLNNQDW